MMSDCRASESAAVAGGASVTALVRRLIKTGIGFLAAGLLLGLYMLVRRELFGACLVSALPHGIDRGSLLVGLPGLKN
jgi:hypothetical protein